MGSLGGQELLLILVLALLLFGPRKLPELGKTIGRALSEFRSASNELRSGLEREVELERRPRERDAGPTLARPREAGPTAAADGPPAASPEDGGTSVRS